LKQKSGPIVEGREDRASSRLSKGKDWTTNGHAGKISRTGKLVTAIKEKKVSIKTRMLGDKTAKETKRGGWAWQGEGVDLLRN